jgi:BlaI family transcriptional regulator, penicillinase repressor
MKTIRISEAEWQVMTVVWQRSPATATEIVDALAKQTNWHPRTVRTLVGRLVRKGALKAVRGGKRYLYEPRLTMDECVRQESRSFAERVFGGEPAVMLLHLVKEAKLSKEDIKELRKVLEEKEK